MNLIRTGLLLGVQYTGMPVDAAIQPYFRALWLPGWGFFAITSKERAVLTLDQYSWVIRESRFVGPRNMIPAYDNGDAQPHRRDPRTPEVSE